jgi:methyl-accepting chemotaxis protein
MLMNSNSSTSPNLAQGLKFTVHQQQSSDFTSNVVEGMSSPSTNNLMSKYENSLDTLTELAQVNPGDLSSSVEVQEYKDNYSAAWNVYNTQNDGLAKNINSMFSNINDNLDTSEELNANLSSQEQQVNDYTSSFQQNTAGMDKLNSRIVNVSAEAADSTMIVKSAGMQYLVYIILLITIVSITSRAVMASEESKVANLVILIILLMLVFYIARWIYHKLF